MKKSNRPKRVVLGVGKVRVIGNAACLFGDTGYPHFLQDVGKLEKKFVRLVVEELK